MKFEEALAAMREGKKIKLHDQDYHLSMISKIYYDSDTNRCAEILSSDSHILRDDWEIVND